MRKRETEQIQVNDNSQKKGAGDTGHLRDAEQAVNKKISMEISPGAKNRNNNRTSVGRTASGDFQQLNQKYNSADTLSMGGEVGAAKSGHRESRPDPEVLRKIRETPENTKEKWIRDSIEGIRQSPDDACRQKMKEMEKHEDETVKRHIENHKNLKKLTVSGRVIMEKEKGLAYVSPKDILPPKYCDPQHSELNPKFLYEHGNRPEDYIRLMDSESAKQKYSIVMSELSKGINIDELKQKPEYKETMDTWWGESNSIKLVKHNESYIPDRDGTHRIYFAQKNGLDKIPVNVTHAKEKKVID